MDLTTRELNFFVAGVVATVGLSSLLYSQHHNITSRRTCRIIDSPLQQIQNTLTKEQQKRLPYPPNVLQGSRDVPSPFGLFRVYEFGPQDGRKVMLIHGISTPSIALYGLGEELVKLGCRVMLFDLFGRGFSSTPDPREQPQNMQLFTTQILLALSSSPISWTGSQRFTLIGYSLGGGIAASFASYFPESVESLVLIAPSGLMRPSRIHWTSRLLYGDFLPPLLVEWLVWKRLGGNSLNKDRNSSQTEKSAQSYQVTATQAVEEEASNHPALAPDSPASISRRRPSVTIADVVAWQLNNHEGFLPAFVSSIKHAPVSGQQDRWKLIADRQSQPGPKLREGKVLLILGKIDSVVDPAEMSDDAKAAMGDVVDIQVLEGGHEIAVTDPENVAQAISTFWKP